VVLIAGGALAQCYFDAILANPGAASRAAL
jgi:hypothetical protein